jgi:hypothetical protein
VRKVASSEANEASKRMVPADGMSEALDHEQRSEISKDLAT